MGHTDGATVPAQLADALKYLKKAHLCSVPGGKQNFWWGILRVEKKGRKKAPFQGLFLFNLAEAVGFEPTIQV